jgi:hypothetical protein
VIILFEQNLVGEENKKIKKLKCFHGITSGARKFGMTVVASKGSRKYI